MFPLGYKWQNVLVTMPKMFTRKNFVKHLTADCSVFNDKCPNCKAFHALCPLCNERRYYSVAESGDEVLCGNCDHKYLIGT